MVNDTIHQKICNLVKAQKPGMSLAQAFYKDPDIFVTEIENIFCGHWLFAAHTSQIPNIGDYVLCEFEKESVIIVRDSDQTFSAHINVCRHRGSRICLEKTGNGKKFTCPYHAWTYGLDGALVSAGQMPEGFDRSALGLKSVHLENIAGFLFICLADKPPSLDRLKADLADVFDIFKLDQLKLAAAKSYSIASNWKLAVENYQECYHCAPAHKEFARIHAMARPLKKFQAHKAAFTKANPQGVLMREVNAYFDLAKQGVEGFQYGRNPLVEGKLSGSYDGSPLAPLLGKLEEFSGGASELMIGPLMYFLIYDDHMVGYRFLPVSQDDCVCDVFWFVRGDAVEGEDYDVAKLIWLWDVTTQSDQTIIENNQKGVDSRFYAPGPLSEMEHFLQSFLRWYIKSLSVEL